jgi:hypothetical protein
VRAVDLTSSTYDVTTVVGAFDPGFLDGLASNSLADSVFGLALDDYGKIVFADRNNNREC